MGPGVPARPMSLAFDVFWSFRSPYSYLATPRLVRLVSEYDVEVNVRVVLPIAVRLPGFFETVNRLWPRVGSLRMFTAPHSRAGTLTC